MISVAVFHRRSDRSCFVKRLRHPRNIPDQWRCCSCTRWSKVGGYLKDRRRDGESVKANTLRTYNWIPVLSRGRSEHTTFQVIEKTSSKMMGKVAMVLVVLAAMLPMEKVEGGAVRSAYFINTSKNQMATQGERVVMRCDRGGFWVRSRSLATLHQKLPARVGWVPSPRASMPPVHQLHF